jgi:hypothetical protein
MKSLLTRSLLTVFVISIFSTGISYGQDFTPADLTQVKQRIENLITVANQLYLVLGSYSDSDIITTEDKSKIIAGYNDIKAQQSALMFDLQENNLLNNDTIQDLITLVKDLIDNASILLSVTFSDQNTPKAATASTDTPSAISTNTSEYATSQVASDQTSTVDQSAQTTDATSSDMLPALFSNLAIN